MNGSASMARPQCLFWPALVLFSVGICAFLTNGALIALIICAGLLFVGIRYPIATACVVLVAIPLVDQAIAETEFAEVFGAFRVTPAVLMKGMMALVIVSYLVRKRVNPLRYRLLRPLLIWLAYTMATCLAFHDRAMAFSMWMRLAYWVVYLVFFFVVAAQETDSRNVAPPEAAYVPPGNVLRLWKAGLIAITIFAGSVFLAKAMGLGGEFYGVGESYGFYADPWNMALTLPGGSVIALLYPWVSGDERFRTKLTCSFLAVATVLASYLTFTRTSLIACLAAVLLFTFGLRRAVVSKRTKLMFVLALVVVAAAVLFVIRNVTSTTSGNQVAARWSEVNKGSVGSGRLEVFYAAWSKFAGASPVRKLVGHGIGAGPEAAEEFTGVYVFLHDDLLEMLVCTGLIGVGLYCSSFARMYGAVLAALRARDIWAVAALTGMAVYSLTAVSYMRIYAVTPNTYFALVAGTSLGMIHRRCSLEDSTNEEKA